MNDDVQELRLLRSAAPAVAEVDQAAMERARRRLDHLIEHEVSSLPSLHKRRERGRRIIAGSAVAAALAGLLVVGQVVLPSGRGGPERASALRGLAAAALAGPEVTIAPGAYAYQSTSVTRRVGGGDPASGDTWHLEIDALVETWVGPDGSGRLASEDVDVRFIAPTDERAWRDAGSPPLPLEPSSDQRFDAGDLPFFVFEDVPNEPNELRTAIERNRALGQPGDVYELLDAIADLLRRPYAPPRYRATLFEVAADLGGGLSVSASGGRVTASVASEGKRLELIFDEATSELLVERTYEVLPDGSETMFEEIRYLESGIVGSIDERP